MYLEIYQHCNKRFLLSLNILKDGVADFEVNLKIRIPMGYPQLAKKQFGYKPENPLIPLIAK